MFGSCSDNGVCTCPAIKAGRPMEKTLSLQQRAWVLSIVLILAAYTGHAQAAEMTLGVARLVVLNSSYTDFLPDGIMTGDKPEKLVSCRYEELDPTVQNVGGKIIVNWGSQFFGSKCNKRQLYATEEQAQQFASALLRWKKATPEERQTWQAVQHQDFVNRALDYRVANPKPIIPEEVRRYKILAEAAAQEKRYSDAARAYEFGTAFAPWWAEGHFNAALMWGEIHHYAAAVDHMKKYLILKPDASDARMAQDQIYKWGGDALPYSSELTRSVEIGVTVSMLSSEEAKALQKPDLKGVLVGAVGKDSVAEKAGISKGDVIVKYGDKPIASALDLLAAVMFATKPGSEVPIHVIRGAQELILTAQY